MAKIAVDIDSTLYDFESAARDAFTKMAEDKNDRSLLRGAYHPWTEWRSPADACGLDAWLEAIALCHDADVIESRVPFEGAVETCQALADEGHELLYISNRTTESQEATERWLDKYGFLAGQSDVVTTTTDKAKYMAECQYLIDDRPKTAIDFLYDYDWNTKIRRGARNVRQFGPEEDNPFWSEWEAEHQQLLKKYYEGGNGGLRERAFDDLDEIAERAAEAYVAANRRRVFMKAYPYNQALTDIPHIYLAPSWAGLNSYLVGKGVLSKPAHIALGING